MKKALIYGEFLETSSTGIAYVNSVLEESIIELKYQVTKIYEPRSKDYAFYEKRVIKKPHIFSFIKVIFKLFFLKAHNISFLTLSMGNLGLLKTLIIQFFLSIKTKRLYLYIHRGDLNKHYKKSTYKKIIINLILRNSFKIIFLSKKIKDDFSIKAFDKKIIIIPNSLSKEDSLVSKKIFERKKNKIDYKRKKQINLIFCGNIQKEKGIYNIIHSILHINKTQNQVKLNLDIYGIKFEEIPKNNKFINYKGRLSKENRLKIMSKYDFLITASLTEGLPMTIIECLALGIPFITTKVGAISDLLVKNYPYICTHDTKSIIKNLNKIIFDFYNKKEYLSKLIIKSNAIYNKKFKYDNYISYIQEYIIDV